MKNRAFASLSVAAIIAIATMGVIQAAPNANITDGLVGYWAFDELTGQTASDSSVSGNDAVVGSSPAPDTADPGWTLGKIGGALDFDGLNDFVNAGDQPVYELPNYSYSMWLNADNVPGTSKTTQPLSNADQQFVLSWDHVKGNFVASGAHKTGSVFNRAQIATPLQAQTWYHIAVTYDGSFIRIYVDGILDASGPSAPPNVFAGDLLIGSGIGGNPSFDGKIDEVRIYNRALSDLEVDELFTFDGTQNNTAPDLASIVNQQVDSGDSLVVALSATDADGDDMTLIAPDLPDFATLNDNGDGTGSITFAPGFDDAGVFPIEVFVTDDGGLADSEQFELTVIDSADVTTGLVGYWKFDDLSGQVAADSSGEGNDGILGASAAAGADDPVWVPGMVGGALRFDGSNDHVVVTDDPDFQLPVYSYTMWIKGDSAPGTSAITQPLSNADQQFSFTWNHPNANFVTSGSHQSGAVFPNAQLTTTLQAGTWYHIAVTYDGSFLRIYLNGNLEETMAAGPPNAASGNLYIGASSGSAGHFGGFVDEVRVYNRALDDLEVQKVQQFGGMSSLEDGLVAHWPFDDAAGQLAADDSGNGHVGILGASASAGTDDPAWVSGKIDGAVSFDGTNDFVMVNDDPAFALPMYSYSMWVNGDNAPGTNMTSQPLSNADQQFVLSWDHVNGNFVSSGAHEVGPTFRRAQIPTALESGVWYHIAVTYDGDFIRIYLDGTLADSVAAGTPNVAPGDLIIGASSALGQFFSGLIDDVRIYDRPLSNTEVQQLFLLGGSTPGNNRPVVDPIANQQVEENGTKVVPISASDPDSGDTLTLSSPNLPPFGSLVDNGNGTGSITFSPGSGDTGDYGITVEATDSGNLIGTEEFTLTVGTIDITTGLVGYWKFDDLSGQTATDSSGNNNNGTLGSSTASGSDDPAWVLGRVGGALSFDGSNDFMRVIDDPDFELPIYSYSMWINGDNAPGTSSTTQPFSNADQQLVLSWDHTKSNFVTSGTHQSGTTFASAQITDALQGLTWYHIAVTYDGSFMRIYLNGVLKNTVASGPPNVASGDLHVGAGMGPSRFFAGVIDDVRVYDRALTDIEVQSVFQFGNVVDIESGLVGYWPLDEGTGQTATDASGNGNDGVLGTSASAGSDDPAWVAGQLGGALDFDGFNDFMKVTDDPDFALPVYSYSLWINGDNAPGTSFTSQAISNADQQFSFSWDHVNPNYVRSGSHQSGSVFPNAQISTSLQGGTWYHVTVTYDGASIRIYLNGILQETMAAGLPNTVLGDLFVGSGAGPNLFFAGLIDDVRIYNVVLTDEQVQAVFEFDGTSTVGNSPPVLDPIPNQQVNENETLAIAISASDPDAGDTLTLTSPNLPSFATLLDNGNGTGSISFEPGSSNNGTYEITVRVVDSGNLADTQDFTLVVGALDILTGLVGYWPFDDGAGQIAVDESGKGNDGILGATTAAGSDDPVWATGQVGGALDFDGSNDFLKVLDDPDFALPIYSFSLWVNGDNVPGTVISTQPLSNADQQFSFSWDHTKPEFVTSASHQSGAIFPQAQLNTTLQAGTWYHIAATYDGSFIRIYLDGSLEATMAAGAPNTAPGDLFVGAGTGPTRFFSGLIDEVRIYDRTLTDSEVQAVFDFGGASSGNTPPALNAIADQEMDKETTLVVPLSAIDPGDTITLTSPNLPSFGVLTDNGDGTGSITFNPGANDTGIFNITVTATDSGNLFDSESFTLTVGPFEGTLGLVGYWTFDEGAGQTATDSSGNGNHAVLGNGPTSDSGDPTWVAGKVGGALEFDGLEDWVNMGDQPEFLLTQYTYALWVNGDNVPGGGKTTQPLSNANQPFSISWDHVQSQYRKSGTHDSSINPPPHNYIPVNIASPLSAGVWYHITVTYDGSFLRIYLNGILEDSAASGPPKDIPGNLQVGAGSLSPETGPISFFDGKIDEVRVYDRALSNAEIQDLVTFGQ